MAIRESIRNYFNPSGQIAANMKRRVHRALEDAASARIPAATEDEVRQRSQAVRRIFIEAVGGLDFPDTSLDPVYSGEIEEDAYTIRKVMFNSLPGFPVTSNLYVPRRLSARAPAVLFACGHFESAKAAEEYQRVCIDLVRNGFVVLTFDPIGQGERMQYFDAALGRPVVHWGVSEHFYAGLACHLTGGSIARYFIRDCMRAIDLLSSLPEVDPNRIGMTGNSGGGMQTAYMMIADERLKVAVPATWLTSWEAMADAEIGRDGEQTVHGLIAEGINHEEFLACFAPRPVMIAAVESDFFPVEGALQTYERAKRTYEILGCPGNLSISLTPGTHSYNDAMRKDAVTWFVKHLCPEGTPLTLCTEFHYRSPGELNCTRSGQVRAEDDRARTVHDLNLEYRNALPRDDRPVHQQLAEALRIRLEPRTMRPRFIDERTLGVVRYEESTLRYRDVFFPVDEDVVATGVYIDRIDGVGERCTILLLEEGTVGYERHTDLIRTFLEQGDVLVLDPRGTGASAVPLVDQVKWNSFALMLGTSLTALRTQDVLRACDVVRQLSPRKEVALAGKGANGLLALFAAVLRDDVSELYLENLVESLEELVTNRLFVYDPRFEMYGVAGHFDIPGLIEYVSDRVRVIRTQSEYVGEFMEWRAY